MRQSPDTQKHEPLGSFTPGPWSNPEVNQVNYMGDTYNAEVIYQRDSADLVPIAFVVLDDPEQSVANARLIASAPSMYLYLASKAGSGDTEAQAILEVIHGRS